MNNNDDVFPGNLAESPVVFLFFWILSAGLYNLYWLYRRSNELNKTAGQNVINLQKLSVVATLLIIPFGFVLFVEEPIDPGLPVFLLDVSMALYVVMQIRFAFLVARIVERWSHKRASPDLFISFSWLLVVLYNLVYVNYRLWERGRSQFH